jgi:hypothetical protein
MTSGSEFAGLVGIVVLTIWLSKRCCQRDYFFSALIGWPHVLTTKLMENRAKIWDQ